MKLGIRMKAARETPRSWGAEGAKARDAALETLRLKDCGWTGLWSGREPADREEVMHG